MTQTGHLIYKCGGIDKRTIEKFEKVSSFPDSIICCQRLFLPDSHRTIISTRLALFFPSLSVFVATPPPKAGEGHTNPADKGNFFDRPTNPAFSPPPSVPHLAVNCQGLS
jgi:hypothetical protein